MYRCRIQTDTLAKLGIEVTYVDTNDLKAVEAAIKENTKLIYFETLTNPNMELTDIAAISKIAHEHGAIVAVDNTFTPPPQVYPLKEGGGFCSSTAVQNISMDTEMLLPELLLVGQS